MNKKTIIFLILIFIFSLFLVKPTFAVSYACITGNTAATLAGGQQTYSEDTCGGSCISPAVCQPIPEQQTSSSANLDNPLGVTSIPQFIGMIIKAILGIVGSLALVMVIYGGLLMMTAHGNEQQVTKGKDVLIWAVLGLVVIFTSYALVRFVFTSLDVK